MKLQTKLWIFLLVITLVSCSKETDLGSPIHAEITGNWKNIEYTLEGRTTSLFYEDFEYYDFTGIGWLMDFHMVFSENPQNYSLIGDYFLDNDIITDEGETYFYQSYDVFNDQGTWDINGNVITLTIDGEVTTASISLLSDDLLILRMSSSTSELADDNVTTTTTTINEKYTFERN